MCLKSYRKYVTSVSDLEANAVGDREQVREFPLY